MLGCFRRPTLYARSGKPSMARLYPGVSRYARPGQSGRARSGRAEPCSAAFGDPPCTPDLASRAWLGSTRVSAGTPGPASRAGPSSGRAEPCSAAFGDPPCTPDPASREWLGSTRVSAGTHGPASRAEPALVEPSHARLLSAAHLVRPIRQAEHGSALPRCQPVRPIRQAEHGSALPGCQPVRPIRPAEHGAALPGRPCCVPDNPPGVGQRVVCPNTSSMTNWLPKNASSSSAIAVRVQCTALAPRQP